MLAIFISGFSMYYCLKASFSSDKVLLIVSKIICQFGNTTITTISPRRAKRLYEYA